MKHVLLFFVPMVSYVLVVINIRALNRLKYAVTAVTDFTYAILNFWIINQVVAARPIEAVVYAAGAMTGSLLAMWITRHWS